MDYSEYKGLRYRDKKDYLNLSWNSEDSFLTGTVKWIQQKNKSFFIYDVTNLEGSDIINPFTEKILDNVHCEGVEDSNLYEKLKEGDQIIFKFVIHPDVSKEKDRLIVANARSVSLVKDLEFILQELKETDPTLTLNDIIKREYSEKRVVFSDEILKVIKKDNANLAREVVNMSNKSLELEKEIIERQNKIEELDKISRKYKELGFELEKSNSKTEVQQEGRVDIIKKSEQIEYIQKYLSVREDKNLYYDRYILDLFFSSLCTDQIIVLCGEPGTGKTSLVEGFADAISAECRIIPVQPNWTDNQDLLGFYNPIEKTYVSTPFLDVLIEAIECPEKLFIVCLDEMNLAHVEYYFSEFLSKLQSTDKTLNLYSEHSYSYIKQELNARIKRYLDIDIEKDDSESIDLFISGLSVSESEEYFKLRWQWNMFKKYSSNIKIPDNIRFVGTVNKDETTKGLSPKVVDRSCVIEIGSLNEKVKKEMEEKAKEYKENYSEKLYLNADNFKINK